MALREKYRGHLKDKPKAIALLDELFLNPYITVAHAAKILEVSNPTARQTVSLLVRAGMLKEISGRKWGQLYLAGPIMKVIEKAGSDPVQSLRPAGARSGGEKLGPE